MSLTQKDIHAYFKALAESNKLIAHSDEAKHSSFFVFESEFKKKLTSQTAFPALMLELPDPQPQDNGANNYWLKKRMAFTVWVQAKDATPNEQLEALDLSEKIILQLLSRMYRDDNNTASTIYRAFEIADMEPWQEVEMLTRNLYGYRVIFDLNTPLNISYNANDWL